MLAALGLAILIPLSVDKALGLQVGPYTLRLVYLSYAALLAVLGWQTLNHKELWRSAVLPYLNSTYCKAIAALVICGLIGTLGSEHPARSWAFLVWTAGTLATVPLATQLVLRQLGPLPLRALAAYFGIYSAVVLIDSMICTLPGFPHIARVIIVLPDGCRPYGFYQEPNYFAAFGLLVLVNLRLAFQSETRTRWRQAMGVAWGITALAIVASTSKTGIIGVLLLVTLEAALQARRLRESGSSVRRPMKARKLPLALATLAAVSLGVTLTQNKYLSEAIGQVARITSLGGTSARWKNAVSALDIAAMRPAFGVGPGATWSFILKHEAAMPRAQDFMSLLTPDRKEPGVVRNDPFFYNVVSETVSEWGILGFLALLIAMINLIHSIPLESRWPAAAAIAVIAASWQTLPRFDLWVGLSLLWAQSVSRRHDSSNS